MARWVPQRRQYAEGEADPGSAAPGCSLSSCPTPSNVHVSLFYLQHFNAFVKCFLTTER